MDNIESFNNPQDPSYNHPVFRPTSLQNLIANSNDISSFIDMLIHNLWLLLLWYEEY